MVKNIVAYLIAGICFLSSCSVLEEQECAFSSETEATVIDISLRNVDLMSYNNLSLLLKGDTVQAENHYIWIESETEFLGSKEGSSSSVFSCSDVTPLLQNRIESIDIYALVDLNDSIKAGSQIDQFFVFKSIGNEDIDLEQLEILNSQFQTEYSVFIKSLIPFEDNTEVSYEVVIKLSGKNSITKDSDPIFITR